MQQIVGMVGMVLFFLASSFLVFQEKIVASLWAGAAALAFLGISVLDLSALKRRLGAMVAPAAGALPKRAKDSKASKLAPAASRISLKALVAAPQRFRVPEFNVPESFAIGWNAYLIVTSILLLAGQALIFGSGRYLSGWALTLSALGLFGHYLKSPEPALRIPLVRSLPAMLSFVGAGLFLEIFGFYMAWIQLPYVGFFLIVAGTVALTIGLWYHLELPRRGLQWAGEGLRAFDYAQSFGRRDYQVKAVALLVALAAFASQKALASYDQIAIALVIGTLALVFTFPWTPVNILSLDKKSPLLRRALTGGLVLMALAVGHKAQLMTYNAQFSSGLWTFLIAILLFAAAFPPPSGEADEGRPARVETVLLAAMVLLAFVLRIYKVGSVPVGIEGDEAGYGWWAQELQEGRFHQIFIHAAQGLYWYFAGASFLEWFGVNPLGVRMHSVFHGFLGILTFYLFLRLFFSWRTAIVTSLLLTFGLWHLHFSRFGHYNVTTHFAQAILFYYLFRAARHQKLHDFVLAGIGLSLAAQTHVAARLLPFFLTVFVGYLFVFHRTAFKRLLPGIIIIIATSWILLSGPWIQFIKNPVWMMGRIKDVSITNENNSNAPSDVISGVAQSFKSSMLMFNFRGDSRPRDHFMAPDPMLDHWTAILFVIGFGLAVLSWRRALYGFAIIAFFGTLLSSVMSVEAPQSLRTAGNITFVYLFVAIAIDRLRWGVEEAFPVKGRWLFLGLAIPAALWIGNSNIKAYWARARVQSFDALSTEIGMKAQELGRKSKVGFQSEFFGYSHPPVFFFANGSPIKSTAEMIDLLPITEKVEEGYYVGFSDRYSPAWKTGQYFYPEGKAMDVESWLVPGVQDYKGWYVTAAQVEAAHGFKASYRDAGAPVETVDRVALGEGQPPATATGAEWSGSIYSQAYCLAKVYFETTGSSEVWVNGRQVSTYQNGKAQARDVRLPGGLISVRIKWSGAANGKPGQLVWERNGIRHVGQGYFDLTPYESGKKAVESRLSFHSIKPSGLLQRFYTGPHFKGEALIKVDPVLQGYWISAGYGNISWRWTGTLKVSKAGLYDFRLSNAPVYQVFINGRLQSRKGLVADTWPGFGSNPSGPVNLQPGRYPIEVHFGSNGGVDFQFDWQCSPAGTGPGPWELVPAEAMEPEPYLG